MGVWGDAVIPKRCLGTMVVAEAKKLGADGTGLGAMLWHINY